MLMRTVIVVVVLLALFFLLRSMMKSGQQQGPRTFRGARFSRLRKEVNKGELVRDSLSGTYVSKDDAVTRTIDGTVHYFASEENAEEFLKQNG